MPPGEADNARVSRGGQQMLVALAAATAGAVLLGAGAVCAAPTAAGDATVGAPRMLRPADLPTTQPFGAWDANPVRPMDAHYLCEEEAFPIASPQVITGDEAAGPGTGLYRIFTGAENEHALTQYAAALPGEVAAQDAAAQVRRCFSERVQRAEVGRKARGKLQVEATHTDLGDGLATGVVTRKRKGPDDVTLWAVGRDGVYVTALVLPTRAEQAPIRRWQALAERALERVAR